MSDIAITVASVLKGPLPAIGNSLRGIAGVAITAGQALYVDTNNNGVLKLADAASAAPVNAFAGIAEHGALAGQPISYRTNDSAFIFGGAATAGDRIYLSGATAGGLTLTDGDLATGMLVTCVGVCVTGGAAGTATINLSPTVGGVKP